MTALSYDRYCTELGTQIDLLRSCVKGADLTGPVAACPDWNLGQLLWHIGGAHHWAEIAVRTRATQPVAEELVNDVSGHARAAPEIIDAWLAEGTSRLTDALRAAGPEARVWTPGPGGTTAFWARRMLYEVMVHRADASRAVGAEFAIDEEFAVDGVEEWMEFATVPEVVRPQSELPPLLGPGRTLSFRGTDTASDRTVEWLVDLTGNAVACHRGDARAEKSAAVRVRASLTDLLLLLYRRRTAGDEGVEVDGDTGLLDVWLERSGFWLRE
ncbi:maleylpyruvate isomerase family mycothiol-dependent enzyme [Streptomyces tsukubensis]|uniref:Maleylpyruvate isomerase family mycothiol-dependent enzyme n=1 Tax=Streptomyces tsukubensis TaxID=83656 RepID=A0A1V4AFM8_9ACTN|nr:maleylpyruvate isomerase family mycothiol-dependent enzyme [Streptomyces tsukubensis]OON82854.1 hypothetical protein B1H18_02150 [Streptomyces tsukubensis]QFR91968.1 maleylpyruvate isomerase family mycothiol-dependent enzyme [Streptomyces tsukubensis]